VARLWNTRLWW